MVSLTPPPPEQGGAAAEDGAPTAARSASLVPASQFPVAAGGRGTAAPATTPPPAPATTPPAPAAPATAPPLAASPIPPGQWRPSPFPTNAAAQGSGGGLFRPSGVVYAVSADGMFRTLGLVSGKDVQRPAPFVPAGARFSDLIAVNDKVYTATSGGCGGAADGVWAIDIASDTKPVVSWKTNGGVADRVCRLRYQRHRYRGDWAWHCHGRRLRQRDRRARSEDARREGLVQPPGVEFAAPPVLFQEAGKDIVAVTTRDGRILLLDAGLSRRRESRHAAVRVGVIHGRRRNVRGAVTRDVAGARSRCSAQPGRRLLLRRRRRADGARWLLIPVAGPLPASLGAAGNGAVSNGAILGVKLAHQDGKFSVQPAWISQNIAAPLTPIVVNGVAFAASGPPNAPAALYALHGATGKPLWNSEKTIDVAAVGPEFLGRIWSRVRGNARRHGLRVRVRNGTEVGGICTLMLNRFLITRRLSWSSLLCCCILSGAGAPARAEGTNRRRRSAQGTGQAQAATTDARDQSVDA